MGQSSPHQHPGGGSCEQIDTIYRFRIRIIKIILTRIVVGIVVLVREISVIFLFRGWKDESTKLINRERLHMTFGGLSTDIWVKRSVVANERSVL
jgi:hypothetical protein